MPLTLPTVGQTVWGTVLNTALQAAYDAATTAISGTSLAISGASTLAAISGTTLTASGASTLAGISGTSLAISGTSTLTGNLNVGNNIGNPQLQISAATGANGSIVWMLNNVIKWYDQSLLTGERRWYDNANGRVALTLTPGASAALALLTVESRLVVSDSLKVVGTSGFNNTAPIAKPTVTGSRGANDALASVLTALASYGLITDSSS